ncbi:MAG: hypothetical protein B5M53_01015 [Candidatus Cloacimonas sp. 4484_209]|nr:MAG: hypothetical protein B5M53_01015 [Candidatus Cloacimonas sp. 4484_209]
MRATTEVVRINLHVTPERLKKLEELALRYHLAKEDAKTSKVIWRLVEDAYHILREKDKIKEELRKKMETFGIQKFEL